MHRADQFWVYKSSNKDVVLCESNCYDKSKNLVGKLKEVMGPINEVYFSVLPEDKGSEPETTIYINPQRTRDLKIFLPKESANPYKFNIFNIFKLD